MAKEVRAVIDVGTNSVKLLVAEVEAMRVQPLHEASHQTRLGQGFYETHILQPGAVLETAKAVAAFAAQAAAWKPALLRVIATSAARDAVNKDELLSAIFEVSGLKAEIISGEQEADWAYRGVISDPDLFSQPLLVMDVGGGSTEFILGRNGDRLFAESFPIGSVRLLEKIPLSDPPSPAQLARYESEVAGIVESTVRPHVGALLAALKEPARLVGTGGTSTILARTKLQLDRFDRDQIEGTILSRADLNDEKQRLWGLPLNERRNIVGLPANRADVILAGVVIFAEAMQALAFHSLRVSTRGIRFAALMQ